MVLKPNPKPVTCNLLTLNIELWGIINGFGAILLLKIVSAALVTITALRYKWEIE